MFSSPSDEAALASARSAFMDTLFQDMLGFGACKMIRRILGFAHVLDFEGIDNPNVRGECELAALGMAAALLRHPQQFKSIEDVIEAVPGLQPRRR
jgi:5-methylthioribose kinase